MRRSKQVDSDVDVEDRRAGGNETALRQVISDKTFREPRHAAARVSMVIEGGPRVCIE